MHYVFFSPRNNAHLFISLAQKYLQSWKWLFFSIFQLIRWVAKYPYPMYPREYIYARRTWVSDDDKVVVVDSEVVQPSVGHFSSKFLKLNICRPTRPPPIMSAFVRTPPGWLSERTTTGMIMGWVGASNILNFIIISSLNFWNFEIWEHFSAFHFILQILTFQLCKCSIPHFIVSFLDGYSIRILHNYQNHKRRRHFVLFQENILISVSSPADSLLFENELFISFTFAWVESFEQTC